MRLGGGRGVPGPTRNPLGGEIAEPSASGIHPTRSGRTESSAGGCRGAVMTAATLELRFKA